MFGRIRRAAAGHSCESWFVCFAPHSVWNFVVPRFFLRRAPNPVPGRRLNTLLNTPYSISLSQESTATTYKSNVVLLLQVVRIACWSKITVDKHAHRTTQTTPGKSGQRQNRQRSTGTIVLVPKKYYSSEHRVLVLPILVYSVLVLRLLCY